MLGSRCARCLMDSAEEFDCRCCCWLLTFLVVLFVCWKDSSIESLKYLLSCSACFSGKLSRYSLVSGSMTMKCLGPSTDSGGWVPHRAYNAKMVAICLSGSGCLRLLRKSLVSELNQCLRRAGSMTARWMYIQPSLA